MLKAVRWRPFSLVPLSISVVCVGSIAREHRKPGLHG